MSALHFLQDGSSLQGGRDGKAWSDLRDDTEACFDPRQTHGARPPRRESAFGRIAKVYPLLTQLTANQRPAGFHNQVKFWLNVKCQLLGNVWVPLGVPLI